jgi:L-type amino acid transporter 8
MLIPHAFLKFLAIPGIKLYFIVFSNISLLMNYLGFATWLSIGAAVFCLPYLRWKCPDLPRPIKVNTFMYIFYEQIDKPF